VEFVTGGEAQGIEPTFDLSARAAWSVASSASLAVEYFSRPGTTRHLDLDAEAHHLIFPTVELTLQDGWTISLGAGHCVTRSEPWIVRSVVGFRFGS
jgi:long-subunit fatty acid transport protein